MESPIEYLYPDIEWQLPDIEHVTDWIQQICRKYKYRIKQLSYIFCSDDYLLRINKKELGKEELTDVITFPYEDPGKKDIIADVYISVDRVRENAATYKTNFIDELHRVMIHGLLHLVGYDDKNPKTKGAMRKEEDLALSLRMF